jgi:hypothetical protein
MISIDLKVGELKLDYYSFSPRTDIKLLQRVLSPSELEIWSANDDWNSFRFFYNDLIVILFFKNELLKIIELYPTDSKSSLSVKKIIKKLGGEESYHWGSIEFNEDKKGGYESALIKYLAVGSVQEKEETIK